MNRACPNCFGVDFGVSGKVIFVGGFTIDNNDQPYYHEDEILWDTQQITDIECHGCGWETEVSGRFNINDVIPPLLDPGVEDLPDEEDINAEVSGDTERENSPNILSGSY